MIKFSYQTQSNSLQKQILVIEPNQTLIEFD